LLVTGTRNKVQPPRGEGNQRQPKVKKGSGKKKGGMLKGHRGKGGGPPRGRQRRRGQGKKKGQKSEKRTVLGGGGIRGVEKKAEKEKSRNEIWKHKRGGRQLQGVKIRGEMRTVLFGNGRSDGSTQRKLKTWGTQKGPKKLRTVWAFKEWP